MLFHGALSAQPHCGLATFLLLLCGLAASVAGTRTATSSAPRCPQFGCKVICICFRLHSHWNWNHGIGTIGIVISNCLQCLMMASRHIHDRWGGLR